MASSIRVFQTHKVTKLLLVIVFVAILAITYTRVTKPEISEAISGSACPTGYVVTLPTGVTTGITNVGLYASPPVGTSPVVDRVIFNIDGSKILGRGVKDGTTANFWTMIWQSSVTSNGPHSLGAEVFHTNGVSCFIATGPIANVQNPTRTPIPIQGIMPNSWSGPTNYPVDFQLIPGNTASPEIRQFMQVEWTTNIGSIAQGVPNYLGRFSSGPNGGSGRVMARIFYGGEVKEVEAPVNITAFNQQTTTPPATTNTDSDDPVTGPETDSDSDGIPDASDPMDDSPDISDDSNISSDSPTLTSQVLTTEGPVKDCLEGSIGEVRLKAIESEQSRPTAQEFEKYRTCFARQSFVVAQSLAPIAPDKVREKKESRNVAIEKVETLTTEIEGKSVDKLVLRGKARPNATVLIYIFSEPLVLTTAANASGEWTYTLEDPLEPGEHEAYSLVDTGDGDYERSSVFSFPIAKAEASESNPNGFSLKLAATATATVDNRSQNIFVAGAVSLIAVTIVTLAVIMNRYGKHKSALQSIIADTPNDFVQTSSPISTIEPVQQTEQSIPQEPSSENLAPENPEPPADQTDENQNSSTPV